MHWPIELCVYSTNSSQDLAPGVSRLGLDGAASLAISYLCADRVYHVRYASAERATLLMLQFKTSHAADDVP